MTGMNEGKSIFQNMGFLVFLHNRLYRAVPFKKYDSCLNFAKTSLRKRRGHILRDTLHTQGNKWETNTAYLKYK